MEGLPLQANQLCHHFASAVNESGLKSNKEECQEVFDTCIYEAWSGDTKLHRLKETHCAHYTRCASRDTHAHPNANDLTNWPAIHYIIRLVQTYSKRFVAQGVVAS